MPSDTLTEAQLAEIEAALAKATPGEWIYDPELWDSVITVDGDEGVCICDVEPPLIDLPGNDGEIEANARLIVLLRNRAPVLISALRAALAREAALREALTEALEWQQDGEDHAPGCVAREGDGPCSCWRPAARKALEAKP
jgi:hypothetical protein